MTTQLTQETILKTRQHFAESHDRCIDEVLSGKVKVNNPDKYIEWKRQNKNDVLSGKWDHTFTFQQRARWLQTGECVPLLK